MIIRVKQIEKQCFTKDEFTTQFQIKKIKQREDEKQKSFQYINKDYCMPNLF